MATHGQFIRGDEEMTDRDFPMYEMTGGFQNGKDRFSHKKAEVNRGKPASPVHTHHLHKAFDKDSDNTIPIIFFGILIIGLVILWTILGAGFL